MTMRNGAKLAMSRGLQLVVLLVLISTSPGPRFLGPIPIYGLTLTDLSQARVLESGRPTFRSLFARSAPQVN